MQARLVSADVFVRHATRDFIDFGNSTLDGLKDLERVLMKDIERALDAVVGDGMLMAVVQPRRECEQNGRQHHRRNHHQMQQSNC